LTILPYSRRLRSSPQKQVGKPKNDVFSNFYGCKNMGKYINIRNYQSSTFLVVSKKRSWTKCKYNIQPVFDSFRTAKINIYDEKTYFVTQSQQSFKNDNVPVRSILSITR